jgi:hypothetical protein
MTGQQHYVTQQEYAEIKAKGYGNKYRVISNEDAIFDNSAPTIPPTEVKEFIAKIHQQNETAKQAAEQESKATERKPKRKN